MIPGRLPTACECTPSGIVYPRGGTWHLLPVTFLRSCFDREGTARLCASRFRLLTKPPSIVRETDIGDGFLRILEVQRGVYRLLGSVCPRYLVLGGRLLGGFGAAGRPAH